MKTTAAYNLHDLQSLAKKKLPKAVFEYVDRGVEDEVALKENRAAFDRLKMLPKILEDVTGRTAATTLFGKPLAMPVAIAPTGSAGLVWFQGELELARAAAQASIPFTLATNAMTSIETVAEKAGGRLWFQLNMFADRRISHDMVARAERCGFEALVLTADASVVPNREYNARNGFALPFSLTLRAAIDMLAHPAWFTTVIGRYLLGPGLPQFANFPKEIRTKVTGFSTSKSAARCEDLSWDDVKELRRIWPRKLIIKGVLRPEDAAKVVSLGADAIVVSNHGGRTVDSTIAPIDALPAIVKEIKGRATILLDSGVRRGSDVLKARALGADAVLIGRPTLYGTAIAGCEGALHALSLMRTEIERELGLTGYRTVDEIDASLLATPSR
jgi:(S)-mandelate dehydrogenase